MTPTLYLSRAALDQIAAAESDLYRHLPVTPTGLCVTCAEPEPCRDRYAALGALLRYGVLPRRRPGAAGVRSSIPSQSSAGLAQDHTRSNEAW